MAVPRVRVPAPPRTRTAQLDAQLSDEVELYHRTYTTLLRSSGETLLRVLEPSHTAMNSSLHPLAASQEPDLGAFLYAVRRLPMGVRRARRVVLGQEVEAFERAGIGRIEEWEAVEAPARRRRWFDSGGDVLAVLLASASDLDDLIPTLVAYQVEWNKLNAALKVSERPEGDAEPADCAEIFGGSAADWARLATAWPEGLSAFLDEVAAHERNLRIRMLGGSNAGYARVTRRWWAPIRACLTGRGLADRPIYFVSSNPHSIINLVTKTAGAHADEVIAHVDAGGPDYLRDELAKFRAGRAEGSWENFLYFAARGYYESQPEDSQEWERRARGERGVGVVHLSSRSALRVSAQVMQLDRLDPEGFDSRLGPIDANKLARSDAVIVNVEYPLGVAAYNILREVAVAHETLRGVYVLGKAATLNADVGDVLISSVIHDEHSGTTYWLDNAFSFEDIAPYLVFGSGLDNQRAVTVKSTFLQNRTYLDFYYREAYTVVEMEAGPFCNAVYEIADADRYPAGEAVSFTKLPIDFGIIHYASDTPYSQARTLGARGLDYFGMDSTYASSVAIMRRILSQEGVIAG